MNMNPRILLIEDDASTAASLKKVLCAEDYEVETAGRGDAGLELARQNEYSVVISDLRLPGLGGLDLVARLHAAKPKQPIILMTAHGTTETAIEATKLGACDYLLKPFEADELLDLVASAVASSRLMSEPVEMGEARMDQSAITAFARTSRSSPLIAPPSRTRCWKANCSAMNAARSPAHRPGALAVSSRRTAGPSFLMRLVI